MPGERNMNGIPTIPSFVPVIAAAMSFAFSF